VAVRGRFTEQAADAVRPSGTVDRPVLSALASLVERSVVMTETTTDPTRYRLLESVRSFCRDVDPDPAGTAEAHAAWVRSDVVHDPEDALKPGPEEITGGRRRRMTPA
jgi:hypothetical protein